jgi:hypothetical protein
MTPEMKNEQLFALVVQQCVAEPTLLVAEAAGKVFKRVSTSEGSWSKAASDNDQAERVD